MGDSKDRDEIFISGRELQQELLEEQASTSGLNAENSDGGLPCVINGAMAGLSGGALGYVFGFGGTLVKHRGKGRWKACKVDGWKSAKSFATFGGVYAFVSCIVQRLRNTQDALNGGLAGCATGLALGWSGGPVAAAQNCATLGVFSYVVDYMQLQAAEAASRQQLHQAATGRSKQSGDGDRRELNVVSMVLSPALPWTRPACSRNACALQLPHILEQGVRAVRRQPKP